MEPTHIISFSTQPEGLQEPEGPQRQEIARKNGEILRAHFRSLYERLTSDGILEGITVYSRQESIGTAAIGGTEEKIAALKSHMEQMGIGTVIPNVRTQTIY